MLWLYCARVADAPKSCDGIPLSEYRLKKLERISRKEIRSRNIGTELLLNHAVRAHFPEYPLPLDIDCAEGGKPCLRSGSLFFNISHSGELAVCGVSDKELGVDIQTQDKCRTALARRFFQPNEQRAIACADDPDYEFTRLWTLKESFIKATGKGLAQPLNSFSVVSGCGTGEWQFAHTAFNGYHIAVCAEEQIEYLEYEMVKLLY